MSTAECWQAFFVGMATGAVLFIAVVGMAYANGWRGIR